ncbi:MAG: hypothetical protein H6739_12250 [Alphaproteobacteria bacterium]|nr:hypothetical protein [Alphaproteobacteria bacterium]
MSPALLAFLLACDGDKSPADDSQPAADDSGPPGSITGLTLGEAGLCGVDDRMDPPAATGSTGVTQPSPFGTGAINQVTLGALEDPASLVASSNTWAFDYSMDLETETFDLYVPADYDGSEPYGLVVFINAGNNGGLPGPWPPALDDARLIFMGGRDIGNSVNVDVRMGKSILGASRMLELFNVDLDRVYASGASGGARSSMVMGLNHPWLIRAGFPLCGASWYAQVEQRYETQEPDSHYEFWGADFYRDVDGQPFAEWLAPFGQRWAFMTSYDDFREGDILNIYHLGAEPDGVEARLLETAGNHCATEDAHVRDAIAFVDQHLFTVVEDHLGDGALATNPDAGGGFLDAGAASEADGLLLEPDADGAAMALARARLSWWDATGAVLRLTVAPEAGGTATVGVWPYAADRAVDALAGSAATGLMVQVERGDTPRLRLLARGFGGEATAVLLDAQLADWDGTTPLSLKLHLWMHELRLEPDAHLTVDSAHDAVKVLDDQRSVRLRWTDAPDGGWPEGTWSQSDGAVLSLSATGAPARVDEVLVKDATGYRCAP